MGVTSETPAAIAEFLDTATPDEWVREARNHLPVLLLDHANCELKAASTALGFLYRYPDRTRLAQRMSRLAREELRHFEHYIAFAKSECGVDEDEIENRLEELKTIEAALITGEDTQFRFHSGKPVVVGAA